MTKIRLQDLAEGMVLATHVRDRRGNMLAPAETKLTARHLAAFKTWGIQEADIQGADGGGAARADESVLGAIRAELRPNFAATDLAHPAMAAVFELCVSRRAKRPPQKRTSSPSPPSEVLPLGPPIEPKGAPSTAWVKGLGTLPSLPAIYQRLVTVIEHPRSSTRDIAKVLEDDAGLTARLLRLVNSAMFGFPGKIDSVQRALSLVGTAQIKDLALATSVFTAFKDVPPDLITMRSFWTHSIACGLLSRLIAQRSGESNVESLFVGGLLHDVGALVLAIHRPKPFGENLEKARSQHIPIHHLEREALGHDHAEIGAALIEGWNLSPKHRQMVLHHHTPNRAITAPTEAAVIHLAEILATALELGSSGESSVPELVPRAWEQLRLEPSALAGLVDDVDRLLGEVCSITLGNTP